MTHSAWYVPSLAVPEVIVPWPEQPVRRLSPGPIGSTDVKTTPSGVPDPPGEGDLVADGHRRGGHGRGHHLGRYERVTPRVTTKTGPTALTSSPARSWTEISVVQLPSATSWGMMQACR